MILVLDAWLWLLRRGRSGLIALLVGIAFFELIQPIAIASFGELERMDRLLRFVPPAFFALMNVTPDFLEGAGLAGYLSLGFTHPVFLILASATVIWFAARSLAGEMERGTIQLALARPVSRLRLYLARVLAIISVTLGVVVVGPLGMTIGIAIASPDGTLDYRNFVPLAAAAALLVWCIGGLTLAVSAAANRMGQAVGWAIGIVVAMYVVDYFAALWSALQPLEPFSIFDYYDPAPALATGALPLTNVLVLGGVGLAGAIAGLIIFSRRDLPV